MKIVIASQFYPPFLDTGGPALKVPGLAEGLAARGHEVHVLTTGRDLGKGWRDTRNGVEITYLRPVVRYRTTTVDPGAPLASSRLVRGADMVHIMGSYDLLGPFTALAAAVRDVPYVIEPLGMATPRVRSRLKKAAYHRLVGRRVLAGAAAVVATSDRERADLLELGVPEDRIHVRRNGVQQDPQGTTRPRGRFRHRLGIGPETPLVLFLGRICRIKALPRLIAAFAQAPDAAHLAIVGPDEGDGTLAQVREAIATHHLEDRVHLLGPAYGEGKWDALADADAFVLPSDYESYGNAAAEALMAGIPVILTDQCGIAASLSQDNGAIVVPPTVEGLAAALDTLLRDGALRGKLAEATRTVQARLGWDEPLDQMEDLYADLGGV